MFNKQEIIRKRILDGEDIDYKKLIRELRNQFFVNGFRVTPNSSLCIRNHILISVLYHLNGDFKNSKKAHGKVWKLVKYNLADDYAWSEGPNYFLRLERMMDLYLKYCEEKFFLYIKEKSREWINNYITPDNLLPQIGGNTCNVEWKNGEYIKEDRVYNGSDQTLYKCGKLYLLVRHPGNLRSYIKNKKVHYGIGNIIVYYNGKCVIFPTGYSDYDKMVRNRSYDLKNENSIYFKKLSEPSWRRGAYELKDLSRHGDYIKIAYRINGNIVVRSIEITGDTIKLTDIGSDGINLNLNIHKCDISVEYGGKIELVNGGGDKNDRIFIPSRKDKKVILLIKFK